MTVEIALVFLIIVCALYLFATETLPIDVTALAILVTVMAIPILFHSEWLLVRGVDLKAAFPTVSESLSGLSSTATVTVLCMFILSGGPAWFMCWAGGCFRWWAIQKLARCS
jgi:hypothetical protein